MYMYLRKISLSILLFNDLTLQNAIIDFLSLSFLPFLYPSLPLSSLSPAPPSPKGVEADRFNATAMRVKWMPIPITESRGHIRQYTITYSPVDNRRRQSESVSVPGDQNSVVIGGLRPESSYSVSVAAATGGGMGNISEPVTITPPPTTTTGTTASSMCV